MSVALEYTFVELADELTRAGADLGRLDLRPALREVELLLVSDVRRNFDEQHGPGGLVWAPFARTPSRKRGGATAKLLRDTGLLMASYTPGASGNVERVEPLSLVWGSNLDRAAWHQFGTATIPARPQAGITDELAGKAEMIVGEHAERLILGG